MRVWKRCDVVVVGAALALLLPACGGDKPTDPCPAGTTGSPPNCVAIVPPCTQTTVYNEAVTMASRTLVYFDFSVPDGGRLDVTLNWTFAGSPVGFYLTPVNTCTLEEFNARSCNFLMRSEPSTTKPKKLSQASFTAGNYRWLTGTFGDDDESGSLLIVLSKGTSCPAHGSTSVSASAHDGESLPQMQRATRR